MSRLWVLITAQVFWGEGSSPRKSEGENTRRYFFKWGSRWWFQIFFIFTPTCENDPIGLIFFKWVETTT